MQNNFRKFLSCEEGATAVEYSFLAALIAAAIVGVVYFLGQTVLNLFSGFQLP